MALALLPVTAVAAAHNPPTLALLIRDSLSSCTKSLASPALLHNNPNQPGGPLSTALQCQHFHSCSGCSHEWKLDQPLMLKEANNFFNDLGIPDLSFDRCTLWEWRCRAKLAVQGTPNNPLIGLYQEGTHVVVDIPFCRGEYLPDDFQTYLKSKGIHVISAHHPSINAAVDLLKQGITKLNIQPYDEDLQTGELRYVQMAVTTYSTSLPVAERYINGKVQVALVWNSRDENSPSSDKLNTLSNFLWRNGGSSNSLHLIHSVWVNFQTSSNNVIFGNRWRHLLGQRDFWEHVGGIDICLAPSSFGQANTQAFDSLLWKLQKYVPYGASVVDLYAGAGIIGLSLAVTRKCRAVKCIEINKESKQSFEKSVGRLPKSVEGSISWHHVDCSIEPLHWLEGSDIVVVDPPRKGLDPSLLQALLTLAASPHRAVKASECSDLERKDEKRPWVLRAREAAVNIHSKRNWEKSQSWPQTLIYISCGWESFKEDCQLLLSHKAWRLEKAHAFNFFPGTDSLEILAVFKRGARIDDKKKKKGKKKPITLRK